MRVLRRCVTDERMYYGVDAEAMERAARSMEPSERTSRRGGYGKQICACEAAKHLTYRATASMHVSSRGR